jgi:hypothetical protein
VFLVGVSPATAADKMHNFEVVAFFQLSSGPAIPGHNVAVQLDGNVIGLYAQGFNQRGQAERMARLGKSSFFPIDVKFHGR